MEGLSMENPPKCQELEHKCRTVAVMQFTILSTKPRPALPVELKEIAIGMELSLSRA
jgi:hypothetical protein